MTNREWILKTMSYEELALNIECPFEGECKHPEFETCHDCLIPWLKEEHEGTELQQTKADNVNAPAHYTDSRYECIDEMVMLFGVEQVKAFCRCNAWKYRHRANMKNGAEDIAKADKYLEFLDNLIAFENPHGGADNG